MKQEDKDLLLKDLCARLPYNTMIHGVYTYKEFYYMAESEQIVFDENDSVLTASDIEWIEMDAAEIKPYLFPMLSMTEKQIDELKDLCDMYDPVNDNDYCEDWGTRLITKNIMNDGYRFNFNFKLFEFLNKNKLDYHGLIEKGLAINATNLNIY